MTRQEFMEILGRVLRREMSEAEVAENIRYYENYIDQQIEGGKSEEQVLSELGDPRLIAKTILQVDQQKEEEEAYDTSYGSVYTEDEDGNYSEEADPYQSSFGGKVKVHTFGGAKAWLVLILVVIIVFLVLGTVFTILWKLLPFILIAAVVVWIYRRFFS